MGQGKVGDMSDTPKTDAIASDYRRGFSSYSPLAHARQMERELADAEKRLKDSHAKALAIADKLAEARTEIDRLRGEIEKAHEEGWSDHIESCGFVKYSEYWDASRAKRISEGSK